jgi:hypothetical protein
MHPMDVLNAKLHYKAVNFVITVQCVRNVIQVTIYQETHALGAIRIFHTVNNAITMEVA